MSSGCSENFYDSSQEEDDALETESFRNFRSFVKSLPSYRVGNFTPSSPSSSPSSFSTTPEKFLNPRPNDRLLPDTAEDTSLLHHSFSDHGVSSVFSSSSVLTSSGNTSRGMASSRDDIDYLPTIEHVLLAEVEKNLDLVANLMAEEEGLLEECIAQSPWDRLYVLNNRSIQDKRQQLVAEYRRLLAMKEDLVSGSFKEALVRRRNREEKVRSLYAKDGVFNRLYKKRRPPEGPPLHATTPCKKSKTKTLFSTKPNSFSPSNSQTVTKVTDGTHLHWHDRLYSKGMASMKQREERSTDAKNQREKTELQEYIAGRLGARLHAEEYLKDMKKKKNPSTVPNAVSEVNEEVKKKLENCSGTTESVKKVLCTKTLTPVEENRIFSVLHKRGFKSKSELEDKKKEREMNGCTFRPKINQFSPVNKDARDKDLTRRIQLWRDHCDRHQKNVIHRKKLDILNARMREDHHFRNRMELDRSVAERFLNSLPD